MYNMIEYSYTICCDEITTVSLVNIITPVATIFILVMRTLRLTLLATFYARQFINSYYDIHHASIFGVGSLYLKHF